MSVKRVFLIVLDSFGVGGARDAEKFGDEGSNTFASLRENVYLSVPNMRRLGLYKIAGEEPAEESRGAYARLNELSAGKDTTAGHWELSGVVTSEAMPTYPEGFPPEITEEFSRLTGRKVLCNKAGSGMKMIEEYAEEQAKTGGLIVYTSADSVFQIAAHEEIIGIEELYRCCEIARGLLCGKHGVGRVIARPFVKENGKYIRTSRRKDYSLEAPRSTMPDILKANGFCTIGVGKIWDIFAGRGISESVKTSGNRDGMEKTLELQKRDFEGLCFVNLVDFDMLYGHRNDKDGYAAALSEFDSVLGEFLYRMKDEDVLIITADHGCDPSTESTDHSREQVPLMVYGKRVKENVWLGEGNMSDVSATVLDIFGCDKGDTSGESFWERIKR